MKPLELSVSDATIWSATLESSITILEDVYSTGITYKDHQLNVEDVYSTGHMLLVYDNNYNIDYQYLLLSKHSLYSLN
jgi:hypothetical protein